MKELDKTMYFNATPNIMGNARRLRKNMTNSEKLLWERLKMKQIYELRFLRQHPIDIFIADFYCHEVRLVVELDGEIHDQTEEYDDGRSGRNGKFWNQNCAVKKRLESPPLSEVTFSHKIKITFILNKLLIRCR